jgi:hypothetical protein
VWGRAEEPLPPRVPEPHRRDRGVPRAGRKHIEKIAKIQLQGAAGAPGQDGPDAAGVDAALAELAKVGFDPVFGARPLKRAIQQRIENPLSKLLLEGRFPPKSVDWPTVERLSEAALERRLVGGRADRPSHYAQPDFGRIHQELRRKGIKRRLALSTRAARHTSAETRRIRASPK